jgi:hypothetical protein
VLITGLSPANLHHSQERLKQPFAKYRAHEITDSCLDCIGYRICIDKMNVNDEQRGIWKEATAASFNILA